MSSSSSPHPARRGRSGNQIRAASNLLVHTSRQSDNEQLMQLEATNHRALHHNQQNQKERKSKTMNPVTQFKNTSILPLLIALALVVVAAVPAIATPSAEFG